MKRPELAVALLAAVFAGCTPPPKPVVAPVAPKPWQPAADKQVAANEMAIREQHLSEQTDRLVGAGPAKHRRVLAEILDNLSKALQSGFVDPPSPEFETRIGVIDAAAATVDSQTVDRGRMQSAEDQALRAADLASAEIVRRYLFDDAGMPPLFEALDSKIDAAAHSRGADHDADAADAFKALDAVLLRVSGGLLEKLDRGATPTRPMTPAVPMVPMVPVPSTITTTMPATPTVPTTMP